MTRPIIFYANNILFFTFISLLRTFIDLSIHLSGGLLFNIILLLLKIFDALYLLESCVFICRVQTRYDDNINIFVFSISYYLPSFGHIFINQLLREYYYYKIIY